MSSYAYLYSGEDEIYTWRNDLDRSILAVFQANDLVQATGAAAKDIARERGLENYVDYEDDPDFAITLFATKKSILMDRLKVLGLAEGGLKELIDYCAAEASKSRRANWEASNDELLEELYAKEERATRELQSKYPDLSNLSREAEEGLAEVLTYDPLSALYYSLLSVPDDSLVTLDVSEFAYDGWYEDTDVDNTESANNVQRFSTPPIILTEGVFDISVLSGSMDLLFPHLQGYVRFLDTTFKTEGGTGALVKLLKSFAAAGISNRILAIFDNDAAAYDALSTLDKSQLPSNFKIMHYPAIDLAKDYPTIGPQGNSNMDVNGLAGSIELYLGTDCLTNTKGEFQPIQWTGYMQKLKKYQGEVVNKHLVQERFRAKLKTAQGSPAIQKTQDWNDLTKLIESMIDELAGF